MKHLILISMLLTNTAMAGDIKTVNNVIKQIIQKNGHTNDECDLIIEHEHGPNAILECKNMIYVLPFKLKVINQVVYKPSDEKN